MSGRITRTALAAVAVCVITAFALGLGVGMHLAEPTTAELQAELTRLITQEGP